MFFTTEAREADHVSYFRRNEKKLSGHPGEKGEEGVRKEALFKGVSQGTTGWKNHLAC